MTASPLFIRMKSHGFSLTELLITIGIIAVLATLLFPTLSTMRQRAQATECLNNLKRIGECLFRYASDHRGSLPAVATVWPPSQQQTWGYALWEYAGYGETDFQQPANDLTLRPGAEAKNIFRCPATRAQGLKTPPFPGVGQVNGTLYSYGLNCRPLGGKPGAGDSAQDWVSPIPMTRIGFPATTAMVTETSFCLGSLTGYVSYYGMIPHSGGSNVLFYDGHVEWLPATQIPRGESGNGRRFWGGLP